MKKEFYVYIYIVALIGFSIFLSTKDGPAKSLSWDAMGYNAYYSMLFHDADDLDYFNDINNKYNNCDVLYQFHQKDSTFYTRYTMGWAITHSPFMGLAHLYAISSDEEADFYSRPYQVAAYIGTFFFYWVLGCSHGKP